MNEEHLRALKNIVGEENCLSDKAHLIAYSYDATRTRFEPSAVIFPRNEDDVSKVLKYCNEHIIHVIPRGSGSGFTGGALPVTGGVMLCFEKYMNKILEISYNNIVLKNQRN